MRPLGRFKLRRKRTGEQGNRWSPRRETEAARCAIECVWTPAFLNELSGGVVQAADASQPGILRAWAWDGQCSSWPLPLGDAPGSITSAIDGLLVTHCEQLCPND